MHKNLTTLFTGRNFIKVESTSSTNTLMAEMIKKEALSEGTLICADAQEAGRGQAGAGWESESGKNLLLSFLFHPSFLPISDIFLLNQSFALGIHDYVHSRLSNESVKIKWPNDIYVGNQKISGMLIENTINSKGIQNSILGIGININQKFFSETLKNAISLFIISGKIYDLNEEMADICSFIEARYLRIKTSSKERIRSDYEKVLYRFDERHLFEANHEFFYGKIKAIDDQGYLNVENDEGKIQKFEVKQIKFCN